MTIALDLVKPGNLTPEAATAIVNGWTEDVVAVFDAKNGCVLFTPNFSYNGKYSVCYSDNKGGFMDSIQLGNALRVKDIAFGVTVPKKVKEISEDSILPEYTIDPPLDQPAVTILTVKNPPAVYMLHVDRDVGTIAYKQGSGPNLFYNPDDGWTTKAPDNNTLIIAAIICCICCCCCLMGLAFVM